MAVLLLAVVFNLNEPLPIPILALPVVFLFNDSNPIPVL